MLLPGELLPLHIFEERYKRMIARCLEDGEPFGIVFRDDEGGARRVGCEARVTEVIERFDDGRLNIIVTGERPFRVLDRFEAPDYPAGEVEPVDAALDGGRRARPPTRPPRPARPSPSWSRRVGGDPPEPRGARGATTPTGSPPGSSSRRTPSSTCSSCAPSPSGCGSSPPRSGPWSTAVERSREIAERAKLNGKVVVG